MDKRIKLIEHFYEQRTYEGTYGEENIKVQRWHSPNTEIEITFRDKHHHIYTLKFDFKENKASKFKGSTYHLFDNEELRFLDALGFETHILFFDKLKQRMNDWFWKGDYV